MSEAVTALEHAANCELVTLRGDPMASCSCKSSNLQFTREQIEFIRNEMYASLSCGATDPLFQAIYDRAGEVLRGAHETTCVGSGDPANCPENEGRGCCQPSPASTENIAVWIDNDDNVQWDYELNCDHPSHAVIVRAKRAFKSVCAHGCYPGREICMCRASVGQECCFTVKTEGKST